MTAVAISRPAPRGPSRLRSRARNQIQDYEAAIWRLVVLRDDPAIGDEGYYACVTLIADIFWQTDARVRSDVIKFAATIGA